MTIKQAGQNGAVLVLMAVAMVIVMLLAKLLADGVVYLGEWAMQ